jgi:hypothetical protein
MNAYLFTGLVSEYRHGHFVDACTNIILYGADQGVSEKAFEESLLSRHSGEEQTPPRIEKIVGAPMLDQLLTETGPIPIHWPEVSEEALRVLAASSPDDQEQGYWVDCEQQVRSGNLAPDIRWLQRELPGEIQSGLNWSPSKNYFFLVCVLSPPAAPIELAADNEEEVEVPVDFEDAQRLVNFPQLAPKEMAVVVRAQNSVVAAWLWKRYAAEMGLAGNAIRVDALCDVVPIGEQGTS